MSQGEQMRLGSGEFWFVIGGTTLTFVCFAVSLFLTYQSTREATVGTYST
jgi:hypothetical protein